MNESIDNGVDKFKETKRILKELDKKIIEYYELQTDSKAFFDTYFNNLKNECIQKKEEAIKAINTHYDSLIDGIDKIKQKAFENIQNMPAIEISSSSNPEMSMKYLNDWILEFNAARRRNQDEACELPSHIGFESSLFKLKLEKNIESFKNSFLKNQVIELVTDGTKNISLALLKENLKKDTLCDLVKYRMKNVKPFKNSDKSFSKLFETDDIKWKLYVENNKDGYLSCFIQLNLETLKNKCIEVELQIDIVHPVNEIKNYSKWISHCFKMDSATLGWSRFISYKDLFKEGYYEENTDSVSFEIFIHIKCVKNI